jgi:c-di-GMP-binding flagellar brake protein YcgR
MERRRNARVDINLHCRISSPRSGFRSLAGVTENMSRGDIMVLLSGEPVLSELPCAGDPLIVEIDLPANHAFGRKCMQCQATVVRVSKSETGATCVAMRIHKMRFQSCAGPSVFDDEAEAPLRQLLM